MAVTPIRPVHLHDTIVKLPAIRRVEPDGSTEAPSPTAAPVLLDRETRQGFLLTEHGCARRIRGSWLVAKHLGSHIGQYRPAPAHLIAELDARAELARVEFPDWTWS